MTSISPSLIGKASVLRPGATAPGSGSLMSLSPFFPLGLLDVCKARSDPCVALAQARPIPPCLRGRCMLCLCFAMHACEDRFIITTLFIIISLYPVR